MNYYENHYKEDEALGFFVHLQLSDDDKLHTDVTTLSAYRWKLTVSLPPNRKDLWKYGLTLALQQAENGKFFPVRFENSNMLAFFTNEEMARIERKLQRTTFYVYNVPHTYAYSYYQIHQAKKACKASA